MKEIFRFKQFQVDQRGCAMRINTDGVLLGVFAALAESEVQKILDVGTGTGVIALMLAQHYQQAAIEAIDIDEGSYICSKLNFQASPFASRMKAFHVGIENFRAAYSYDLIVSNPPFFINSLKNANDRKTLSRHSSLSFYEALFIRSTKLLAKTGSFVIVWPLDIRNRVLNLGYANGMRCYREIFIQSFPESESFRVISFFTKERSLGYLKDTFHIYQERGKYSEAYVELLRDFFINF